MTHRRWKSYDNCQTLSSRCRHILRACLQVFLKTKKFFACIFFECMGNNDVITSICTCPWWFCLLSMCLKRQQKADCWFVWWSPCARKALPINKSFATTDCVFKLLPKENKLTMHAYNVSSGGWSITDVQFTSTYWPCMLTFDHRCGSHCSTTAAGQRVFVLLQEQGAIMFL